MATKTATIIESTAKGRINVGNGMDDPDWNMDEKNPDGKFPDVSSVTCPWKSKIQYIFQIILEFPCTCNSYFSTNQKNAFN